MTDMTTRRADPGWPVAADPVTIEGGLGHRAVPSGPCDAATEARMRTTSLGPAERSGALARMAEQELDILVVGGGVVGAGTALDAATRGLSTGIVEARDWASGTSSRS